MFVANSFRVFCLTPAQTHAIRFSDTYQPDTPHTLTIHPHTAGQQPSPEVGGAFMMHPRTCGLFSCRVNLGRFGRLFGVNQFSLINGALYIACILRLHSLAKQKTASTYRLISSCPNSIIRPNRPITSRRTIPGGVCQLCVACVSL